MAKKIVGYIKLQIPAGKANPSPPVGPALGQRGLNIMAFCKEFNAHTQNMEPGMPVPGGDHRLRRPHLQLHHEDAAERYFLMKAAKIDKGTTAAGKARVGRAGSPRPVARDRRDQDEGHERQRHRGRHAHAGRFGPLDGPDRGGGLSWLAKTTKRLRDRRSTTTRPTRCRRRSSW